MKITPIRTPLIQIGQSLAEVLTKSLPRPLHERDVICVASKIISLEQGRVVELAGIEPTPAARAMRRLDPARDPEGYARLMELILREADQVFETDVIWLTLTDGIFIANAGIDLSNAPPGHAVLWPARPWDWARAFRATLRETYDLSELGVIVTDARSTPLRRGFIGMALAYAGFEGIDVQKGAPDLFGRLLQYTEKNVADGLAVAAVLAGGEAAEQTPFVLIEGAQVQFTDREIAPSEVLIAPERDIFASVFGERYHRLRASATPQP